MFLAPLQMGSVGMMPTFDWGSMWLYMVLPTVAILAAVVIVAYLFLRRDQPGGANIPTGYAPHATFVSSGQQPSDQQTQPGNLVLGEVFRTLSPTLMDDEKRVMEELARAGSEVLQSDLPRMTNFSKATVSKAIHSLEVRGIVVRERHKWTYWCKINPLLVERAQRGELTLPSGAGPDRVGASS